MTVGEEIDGAGGPAVRTIDADADELPLGVGDLRRIATGRVNTKRAVDDIVADVSGRTGNDGRPLGADPLVRKQVADLYGRALVHHAIGQRVLTIAADVRWTRLAYQARGTAIAGGSRFIQRNIVAERLLGLPRG